MPQLCHLRTLKSQGNSPEPVHFHRLGQKSGSGRLHNTALGHYKNSYIQSFSPSPCFTNIGSSSSMIFYQNESKMKLRVWSRSDQIPYTATGINQNTSKFSHKKIKVKEVGSSISKKGYTGTPGGHGKLKYIAWRELA